MEDDQPILSDATQSGIAHNYNIRLEKHQRLRAFHIDSLDPRTKVVDESEHLDPAVEGKGHEEENHDL